MVVIMILACIGVYHIIEWVLWQIHKSNHPEEVTAMMDYMENKKK